MKHLAGQLFEDFLRFFFLRYKYSLIRRETVHHGKMQQKPLYSLVICVIEHLLHQLIDSSVPVYGDATFHTEHDKINQ